jgi:TolB-like protein
LFKYFCVTIPLVMLAFAAPLNGQTGSASSPNSVMVVPFANVTGNPDVQWLEIGIAETVVADLEQLQGLSIVRSAGLDSSTETAPLRDRLALSTAREQGVSWLVSGGFQSLGEQLRITARIIDVATGTIRATVKVDGVLGDTFILQDKIIAGLAPEFASIVQSIPSQAAANLGQRENALARNDQTGLPQGRQEGQDDTLNPFRRRTSPETQPDERGEANPSPTDRVNVSPSRTDTPPTIDGRLDDMVWQTAARITNFVQSQPQDGAPASEASDVYIAYDSSNIYLAFHAHYEDPSIMRSNRSDRDQAGRSDDIFSVYFDPFSDQQRAYVFSVNGYGVQDDSVLGSRSSGGGGGRRGGGGFRGGGGGVPRGDSSWDTLFTSGGQIVDDGFTAELAIPFKSLRYPTRGTDTAHNWGFQIVRRIRDKDETVVWSPVSRDIAGFLPQMGVLSGMTGLSTSRNLEFQPTFTGVQFGTLNTETGRVVSGDPKPEGGINVKYGVTSNLTADFTLNPDFSQIESDRPQVEVNQRFALYFPELRPFFLEGAEIFNIPGPFTTVHTRTIVDPLYGAKLTGKAGKTTIGVLYTNDQAPGNVSDSLDPAFEQSAQTFVGRVRYDLYAESYIGAIVTDRQFLNSHSRLAGVDSNFRVGNTHSLGIRAMGTDHRDQEGSNKNGYFLDVFMRKNGRNLSYTAATYQLSPDFKTDVGFVRRTDQRFTFGNISYQWWPQNWLISWGPNARYSRNNSFEGVLEDEQRQVGLNFNFAKNIGANIDVTRELERFADIDFFKTRLNMFVRVNTSQRLSIGGGGNWGDQVYFDWNNPFLGRDNNVFMFINFRPVSRFQSQININTSRFTDSMGLFVPGTNKGSANDNGEVFNVKILRAQSTYQFTERLLFRNIAEINTFDETLAFNFLLTYRVNSGTAFYIGYDDRYQQREQFHDHEIFPGAGYQQTNRAIFTKLQYLFRF